MLCDDIILDTQLPQLYDGMERTYAKIKYAQKFVLSKEFAIAADGLVDNFEELKKIVPYCRIPFPLVWIEWLHRDRPHWDPANPYGSRPVDPSRHQHEPHRIGMLMQQFDKASRWRTHLFWSMVETPISGSRFNGSIQCMDFNSEAEPGDDILMSAIRPGLSEFGRQFVGYMLEKDKNIANRILEYAVEDWGGETRFMIATLGLLNTRNVAEHAKVDHEIANVKRARHGKRPLFSHTILKVRPTIIAPRGEPGSGDHRDLRMHFVRGHFKHRKTGLFWWSTHVRGKLEHGAVFKDYEVEG